MGTTVRSTPLIDSIWNLQEIAFLDYKDSRKTLQQTEYFFYRFILLKRWLDSITLSISTNVLKEFANQFAGHLRAAFD